MTQRDRLFECLKKNNLRQIQLLLDGRCDVNATDECGRSLLMMTLVQIREAEARTRMLKKLIAKGAEINLTDRHGKTALTYACALNQVEAVRVFLDQRELDANIRDVNGATPLMHAASLGHFNVIKLMMEYNQSDAVVIDMKARDDNGNDVRDHAKNDSKENLSKQKQKDLAVNTRKVQRLLENCNVMDEAKMNNPNLNSNMAKEAIELKDMTNETTHIKQVREKSNKNVSNTLQKRDNSNVVFNKTVTVPPEVRDSCIRRWAEGLNEQCEESGRMSSLMSTSQGSMSRSSSRQSTNRGNSAKQRPPSSLSQSKNFLDKPGGNGEDEDDEFSLESLSDLVGTVRQYAQEIREIYAPIQQEEEERVKKRKEKTTKRISKKLHKGFIAKVGNASLIPEPVVQEVCVEIHGESGKPDKPGLGHSRSFDPAASHPMASLHVENEQLSSTWPRGRQRAKSEDRNGSFKEKGNRPDITGSKMSVISAPSQSTSFSRPQIPSDWNEKASLENEREILSNAFKRFNQSNNDPLLRSISENKKNMKLRQHLTTSRQSVIQVGKSHQTAPGATDVPSISIIPPPSNPTASHLSRHGRFHNEKGMVTNRAVTEEIINIDNLARGRRESKDGGYGVKCSSKGLRRRTSIEQDLGQPPAIDKY